MGRPPSNGAPTFRFTNAEVTEMESILQAHNVQVPTREVLDALADKFSTSAERSGKVQVQMKQIWNWFQNRRYAIRAKAGKPPVKLTVSTPQNQNNSATMRNVPRAPQLVPCSTDAMKSTNQNTQIAPAPAVKDAVRNVSESQMEFEARSARDGAWYDVTSFISHRSLETGDPEALVRFAGFGPEEDEWVNVRKHIRQRSLPCESSECIVVLPGDLILCFQEGKEQALYYDAHILDSQRRRHDIRGCRCRFLVRYDHDKSEEIVPLRKICRRPETDHRLQQLDAESGKVNQQRTGVDAHSNNTSKVSPTKTAQKDHNQMAESRANGTVPLETSQQPISGSHNSGHIPNGNQNSKLTQPAPIAETGSNSILTQVRPPTENHAAVEVKLHQISESTVAETGSYTKVTHMLPSPNSIATDAVKVNETSEMTELPPLAEPRSDTEATHMLPSPNSHEADIAKVNETSEIIQLAPSAETDSNAVATQVLAAPENHAAVVAASVSIQNSLPVQSQLNDM